MNIRKHVNEINKYGFSIIKNIFTKKECRRIYSKVRGIAQFFLKEKNKWPLLVQKHKTWIILFGTIVFLNRYI